MTTEKSHHLSKAGDFSTASAERHKRRRRRGQSVANTFDNRFATARFSVIADD
ncbi:MAG TPA: hypothetical protein VF319_00365 [Caldimonas sp.]